jgi:hypothetical protein
MMDYIILQTKHSISFNSRGNVRAHTGTSLGPIEK